jgi:hypothetical protein
MVITRSRAVNTGPSSPRSPVLCLPDTSPASFVSSSQEPLSPIGYARLPFSPKFGQMLPLLPSSSFFFFLLFLFRRRRFLRHCINFRRGTPRSSVLFSHSGLLSLSLSLSLNQFTHARTRTCTHRPLVGVSALSGLLTVALFLYILLIPMIKGIPPNVRRVISFRCSPRIRFYGPRVLTSRHHLSSVPFSIGRGESLASFRPSFRYVTKTFPFRHRSNNIYGRTHAHTLLFPSPPRIRIFLSVVGPDGVDHLGLGDALWRTWSVFGYGIYTRHHWRYVVCHFVFTILRVSWREAGCISQTFCSLC